MKAVTLVLLNILGYAVSDQRDLRCSPSNVEKGFMNQWIAIKSSRENQIDEVIITKEIDEDAALEIGYTIHKGDTQETLLCGDAQGNDGAIASLLLDTLKLRETSCPIKQQKQQPSGLISGSLDVGDDVPAKFSVSMVLKKGDGKILSIELACRPGS